jgi:hypothetical protein
MFIQGYIGEQVGWALPTKSTTIDIYSRRGSENAKEEKSDSVFAKNKISPLRSLRLCEKIIC